MSEGVIYIPPFQLPAKPKWMTPCNGCGWCCHREICAIGMDILETDDCTGPCPFMLFADGRVKCGIVVAQAELGHEPTVAKALGVGVGCDADDPWGRGQGDGQP